MEVLEHKSGDCIGNWRLVGTGEQRSRLTLRRGRGGGDDENAVVLRRPRLDGARDERQVNAAGEMEREVVVEDVAVVLRDDEGLDELHRAQPYTGGKALDSPPVTGGCAR